MKGKSAIEKGKRFEKMLANDITEMGFGLARREIGSGSGNRKGDIACNLPFLIEAKNHKSLAWWKSIDQAKRQAQQGNYDPDKWALVVRDPRTPETRPDIYAVIDWIEFLKLLKKNREPLTKEPDRELKWQLSSLVKIAKQVIKQLEK